MSSPQMESKHNWTVVFAILAGALLIVNLAICAVMLQQVKNIGSDERVRVMLTDIADRSLDRFISEFTTESKSETFVKQQATEVLTESLVRAAPRLIQMFFQESLVSFLPDDIFEVFDVILTTNFQPYARTVSQFAGNVSVSFYEQYEKYYDEGIDDDESFIPWALGNGFTVMSQIAYRISKVQPLTDRVDLPVNNATSAFGRLLLQLPITLQQSLNNTNVWGKTAKDCAVIAQRLSAVNYQGVMGPSGNRWTYNYNSEVQPVFAEIARICQGFANSLEQVELQEYEMNPMRQSDVLSDNSGPGFKVSMN